MSPEYLDALLYDWHNAHLLVRQNKDIDFFKAQLPPLGSLVFVFGAGTGRVSTPLADSGRYVLAVDRSFERLLRIPVCEQTRYWICCADFQKIGLLANVADAALFPYSTFQLLSTKAERRKVLCNVRKSLKIGASVWIDLSQHFETRQTTEWQHVLFASCKELKLDIEEWIRVIPSNEFVTIITRYVSDKDIIHENKEVWYFESSINLGRLLESEGFRLKNIIHGYGDVETNHRHIYIAEKI